MKNYGKIVEYNGKYGSIIDINGIEYKLLDKNILYKDVKKYDNVEFENEYIKTPEIDIKIARFVKILENKKQQTIKK